jgi:hypothetical protein
VSPNETALDDQRSILRFLAERVDQGSERYCTLRTLRNGAGLSGTDSYLRAIIDDLEIAGYVNTRQAYKAEGGRFFQISAKGFDLVESGEDPVSGSSLAGGAWKRLPSNFVLSEGKRDRLTTALAVAESKLDELGASNTERAQARAYIVAAQALTSAPDPSPDLIWEILNRANALAGVASLFVSLLALFMAK